MKITAAVLEETGRARPYSETLPISISSLELTDPGPTEVRVRMEAAGVCHSDLSVVDGNRPRPVPMALGHEAAGIVEAVGSEVEDIRPGQRVVMTFLPRCGDCPSCQTDGQLPCDPGTTANNEGHLLHSPGHLTRDGNPVKHHLGVSGFASHAVVDRASIVAVDPDVSAEVAAVLGCAVLTGGGAVLNAARPRRTDSLMIVGLGGVGMAALLVAVSQGIERIVAVDAQPDKLARARELGAHEAYTPAEVGEHAVRTAHVVECAGNARAFQLAFNATMPGGRTVTVGLPSPDAMAQINPLTITAQARTIIGSYLGSAVPARDIPTYAQLWREGRLPVEEVISSRIRLDEINEVMDQLADAKALRQVIIFD